MVKLQLTRWLDIIHRNYLTRMAEIDRAFRSPGQDFPGRCCHRCRQELPLHVLKTCGCGQTEFYCKDCLVYLNIDVENENIEYLDGVKVSDQDREDKDRFYAGVVQSMEEPAPVAEGCQS